MSKSQYERYAADAGAPSLHTADTLSYGMPRDPDGGGRGSGVRDGGARPAYEAEAYLARDPALPPPRREPAHAPTLMVTDPYGPGDPYRTAAPDRGADPYGTSDPYGTTAPYGPLDPYGTTAPYGSTAAYGAAHPYGRTGPAPRTEPRRRGGRRRARVAGRPDAVRRLLPQALVVAFLAGGTSAFVAKDKPVELIVDGRHRSLHTFAGDVGGLLAEEGVRVGPHDVVAPGPGTALAGGDEISVRHGRPLTLTIDGERRVVWTTAETVEGALRQFGVRAEGAYLSASRSLPIGRTGLRLDVRTERALSIVADGRTRTVRTNAATVGEALDEAGIVLRGEDTTSVPAASFPRDGQTVTVLRVTGTREVRDEPIPFAAERTEDPGLFRGTEVVDVPGRPGLRRSVYLLRTVNGVRARPRLEHSEVVRQPRRQQVRVGTRPHPAGTGGGGHLDWHALAVCESGGRPGAVDPSGTYGGLYQFDTATWHGLGGSGRPQDAPAEEQTMRAKRLYQRHGTSPWPHCGARLRG